MATVIAVKGGVLQLDEFAPPIAWQSVGVGAQARAGDALRTDWRTTATVHLADQSEVILQPSSLLRFRPTQDGAEPEFDLLSGDAYIQAHDKELPVRTTVGVAHLKPGARIQLSRSGGALQVLLHVGEASFRTVEGTDLVLSKERTLKLEIGAAIIRETAQGLAKEVPKQDEASASDTLLLDVSQPGVRVKAPNDETYRELPAGTSALDPGTLISIAPGSRAVLRRADDTVELFGAGDYRVTSNGPLLSTESGKVHMQTQSQDIVIMVPGGWIRARVAGEADLTIGDQTAQVEVQRGEVTVKSGDTERRINPGDPLSWSLPGATSQDAGAAQTSPDPAPEDDDPPASDPREPTPPARTSFTVPLGESFVVHAAELPVAVGIALGSKCRAEATVELNTGARFRGSDVVKIWLDAAVRSYKARCSNKRGRAGRTVARLRALEDAGTRRLPTRPPTSHVDADGRGYTIYYQNQPPDIHVRWPNAPEVAQYQLSVDGEPKQLGSPEYTFRSGTLRDGDHRLTFSALSRRSRTTSVEVRFDSTATTASLNAPNDRGFAPGDAVDIEGVVLPAWKVSVDGGTIEKTGDSRFQGRIVTSDTSPDFAVRLSHRRLGTHYYLRRAFENP